MSIICRLYNEQNDFSVFALLYIVDLFRMLLGKMTDGNGATILLFFNELYNIVLYILFLSSLLSILIVFYFHFFKQDLKLPLIFFLSITNKLAILLCISFSFIFSLKASKGHIKAFLNANFCNKFAPCWISRKSFPLGTFLSNNF